MGMNGAIVKVEAPDGVVGLRLLRELEPDVVFGSAFIGDIGFQEMSPGDWLGHVNGALERLLN